MIKEKVKQSIIDYQKDVIANLKEEFDAKKLASEVDDDDTQDSDSLSHQSNSQEDEERLSDRLDRAKAALSKLERIPEGKKDSIVLGSLIETNNLFIYVGITTTKFKEDGKDIIGISSEAPIFKTLIGQKVGFKFQFAGGDCAILSIQ